MLKSNKLYRDILTQEAEIRSTETLIKERLSQSDGRDLWGWFQPHEIYCDQLVMWLIVLTWYVFSLKE